MPTRYYYDCPVIAAYMAKYFGMRFFCTDEEGDYALRGLRTFFADAEKDWKDCYYIHPDSLHLLEPQINDFILMPFPFDSFGITSDWQVEDLSEDESNWQIIKRNGKAFMMPQREEV